MPPKSRKKTTEEWLNKLELARKVRKPQEEKWKKFIRRYEGEGYLGISKAEIAALDKDYVVINLFKANIQTMLPAVYFQNPKVYTKPKREDFRESAPVAEAVANYWIGEIDFKSEMRWCMLDWMVVGHAWDKVGYFGNVTEDERADDPSGAEQETVLNIADGQPFVKRVSPLKMLIDPSARNYGQARWVAEEITKPLDDAKRKWPQLKDHHGLKTVVPEKMQLPDVRPGEDNRWNEIEEKEKFVVLQQIWYKKWSKDESDYKIRVMLVAEGVDEYLSDEPAADGVEGFPYEYLPWDERIDAFYPQAMFESIEDLLLSYILLRSMELSHMHRFGRKYEARKDSMTPENKEALERGEDGLVLEFDDISQPNIKPIQDAPLDPQHYVNIRQIEKEIREMMGLDEFIQGSSRGNITATQTTEISKGTSLRVQWRKEMLHDFLQKTIRKMWQIIQTHHKANDLVPIVGPDGIATYKQATPEEIQGEFQIEIGVNSTSPPDRQQDIKNAQDRYNLLRSDPKVNHRALIVDYLEAQGVQNVERIVKPQDSLEQQVIEQENQLLSQGQTELAHPGDDHQMHMQAHTPPMQQFESTMAQLQQQAEQMGAGLTRDVKGAQGRDIEDGPLQQDELSVLQNDAAKFQAIQQQIQQLQPILQAYQQHTGQHTQYIQSDMGAGEPVNPNIFNRRAGRQADTNAEFQGG